jgi:hypothetical protein
VNHAGVNRKENVGISNDNPDEKSGHRKSKVSLSNVNRLRVSRTLS